MGMSMRKADQCGCLSFALIIAAWNLNNVTSVLNNEIANADEIFLFKSKMLQPSILMRRINF